MGSVLGIDVAAHEGGGWDEEGCKGIRDSSGEGEVTDSGCYCLVHQESDDAHTVRDALTGKRISVFNSDSKYYVHERTVDQSCTKAIFLCTKQIREEDEGRNIMLVGWHIGSSRELFVNTDSKFGLNMTISLNHAGTRFATTYDYADNIGLYSADTGELLMRFGPDQVCSHFSFDDTRIFTALYTTVNIWDADSGSNLLHLDMKADDIFQFLAVGNFSNVWTVSDGANIVVWDVAGEQLGSVDISPFGVDCGAFGQNDDLFIASLTQHQGPGGYHHVRFRRPAKSSFLYVWKVPSMNCLHQISLQGSSQCISYNPRNNSVLLGCRSVRQLSLETGLDVSKEVKFGDNVVAIIVPLAQVILL
jgi:hypothetical protein